MRRTCVIFVLAIFGITEAAHAVELGIGAGVIPEDNETRLAATEIFGRFPITNSLGVNLSVTYLPPLLPGETPAAAWTVQALLDIGSDPLWAFIGVGGGVLWSGGPIIECHPSLGTMAGIKFKLGPQLSIYGEFTLLVSYRNGPMGSYIYGYLPWSVGIVLHPDGVRLAAPPPHTDDPYELYTE